MEERVLIARKTRKIYIPLYFMILVLWIIIGMAQYNEKVISSFIFNLVITFSILVIIGTEIHRFNNYYEINKNSLVHRYGYLVTRTERTNVASISDVFVKQGPWQRLLGYGDVETHLFAKENKTSVVGVNNPDNFVRILEDTMARRGKG